MVGSFGAMTSTLALRISALLGALAVALGAFGAHGLKSLLEQNRTAEIWEKAVFYHFIHVMLSDAQITSPRLPALLADDFAAMLPLVRWVNAALGLKPASRR